MDRMYEQLTWTDFSKDQMEEIQAGIAQGFDVSIYARKEFLAIQMHEIRRGLEKGLDVKKYASLQYDWFQMEQIRLGLEEGVDVSAYASPEISYDRMKQIRLGLMQKLDLSPYSRLDAGVLKQFRIALLNGINIASYIIAGYDAEQLEEIREALQKGLPIDGHIRPEYRGIALREIFKGLEDHLDVSVYCDISYNWKQMRELRLGLEHMLDVSVYKNAHYTSGQMREIRLGLEAGLDVDYYANLMYTPSDMKKRRVELENDPAVWVKSQLATIDELIGQAGEPTRQEEPDKYLVTVSADEMSAYIGLRGDRETFNRVDIVKELNRHGVVSGIKYDVIDEIVRGNTKRNAVLVAQGQPMVQGEDGWYEYFFRTSVARTPKHLEDGSIDYRDVEWFETVQKGQTLAVYHEAKAGENGLSVTGKMIHARHGKEQEILTGTGFTRQPDGKTYISDLQGIVTICGMVLTVSELLVLQDVHLATGDVSYTGNILVEGNVGSGAKVHAAGDIVVQGFVEAAELHAGGNVFLRKGMNARGNGFVHAAQDVVGYFFENTQVYAGGNIQGDYFMNCNIHAQGMITVKGKKGSFVGGRLCAEHGLHARNLGNRTGIATYIKLGMGDRAARRQGALNTQISGVDEELRALRSARENFQKKYKPELRNTMELYLKIESAIYTKERELEHLMQSKAQLLAQQQEVLKQAEAVVEGSLHEGVTVDIDGVKWNAKTIQNVTVRRVNKRIALFSNQQLSGTVRRDESQ